MIRQLPDGKWRLYSQSGTRNLGTFDTRAEAEQHERAVRYFKSHQGPQDHGKGGGGKK